TEWLLLPITTHQRCADMGEDLALDPEPGRISEGRIIEADLADQIRPCRRLDKDRPLDKAVQVLGPTAWQDELNDPDHKPGMFQGEELAVRLENDFFRLKAEASRPAGRALIADDAPQSPRAQAARACQGIKRVPVMREF